MIYEFPSTSEIIRQGDIFFGLPRMELSLKEVMISGEITNRAVNWGEIASIGNPINAIVPLRSVICIVVSQDCDAARSRDINLCEIREFRDVEGKCSQTTAAKSWRRIITQQARLNQKWFYLPPDDKLGFEIKMAVDFMITIRVPRADLEELRSLRKGRLNRIAREHFRERISEYYRRYPYDEWYPLNCEELTDYISEYPDTKPYKWQTASDGNSEQ